MDIKKYPSMTDQERKDLFDSARILAITFINKGMTQEQSDALQKIRELTQINNPNLRAGRC